MKNPNTRLAGLQPTTAIPPLCTPKQNAQRLGPRKPGSLSEASLDPVQVFKDAVMTRNISKAAILAQRNTV
jgi:hypothetical protein